MSKAHLNPANRMAAVILFDATMSNPNGDPDSGNTPRHHSDGIGVVTCGCIKRKVRDYIYAEYGDKPGFDLFVKKGTLLNTNIDEAGEDLDVTSKTARESSRAEVTKRLKSRFVDLRMFGQVLGTGKTGKALALPSVRGPVAVSYAQSFHPVEIVDMSITRVAATAAEKDTGAEKDTEMGRCKVVRYGLYAAKVFYTPAKDNHITEEDLSIFWEALENLFLHDKCAARPEMRVRKVVIFARNSEEGKKVARGYSDEDLLDLVRVNLRDGVIDDMPTRFEDYEVTVPTQGQIPESIELTVY